MSTPEAPIKLSLSLGPKKQDATKSAKPLNGTKRRRAALHDSDDEETSTAQHQTISHFDQSAGGAIDTNTTKPEKKPLVIPALPNRDRMEDGRRKKQKSGIPVGTNPTDEKLLEIKKEVTFGLNIPEKKPVLLEDTETVVRNGTASDATTTPKEKTEDEMALDALLGNKSATIRTIPTISEEEAYQRDLDEAPEAPTLDQYMAVPVDEFGAALLRGMGWKDTETLSGGQDKPVMKPRTFERRPALLGVGAKPASAVGIEIGEWGKASRGKNSKQESYNPVVLRNKVTGETLTEEELKIKMEEQDIKEMDLVVGGNERARISDKPSKTSKYQDERNDSDRSRRREGDEGKRSHRRHPSPSVDSGRSRKNTGSDRKERSRRDDRSPEEEGRRKKDYDYRKESERRRRERSTSSDARHRSRKHDDSRRERDRSSKDKGRSRHDDERYDQERSKKDRYDRDREVVSDRRRR